MATIDWAGRTAEYLKLGPDSSGTRGALLASLGASVQSAIERHIGRTLGLLDYAEAYDGNDKDTLLLRHDPIASVTSLSIWGNVLTVGDPLAPAFPPAQVEIEGSYLVRTDGGTFPVGRRTVIAVYSAGYDPVPEALVQAGVDWIAALFKDRDRIGLSSESVGGQSFGITHDIPKRVKETLDQWKRTYVP
jgi:hypothetical protein